MDGAGTGGFGARDERGGIVGEEFRLWVGGRICVFDVVRILFEIKMGVSSQVTFLFLLGYFEFLHAQE